VTEPGEARSGRRMRWLLLGLGAVGMIGSGWWLYAAGRTRPLPIRHPSIPVAKLPAGGIPDVWPVERSGDSETYSNGLSIDGRFITATHARSYLAFPLRAGKAPERRTQAAGIVFHTTESLLAPFEARENGVLKRIGESLLEYVRRRQAYNFVIDRFGRVYRVVPEGQAANHAGYSLWADADWAYLNLNESFVGVSFEAETRQPELSPGQIRSSTMLIEMLRSRYRIAAGNCVTHAQVSVNPSNMRVGYHVDWASGFPFQAVGLPDNYAAPLPAVWRFGFEGDEAFRAAGGPRLQAGVDNAEAQLADDARASGLSPAEYRKMLRKNYRQLLTQVE